MTEDPISVGRALRSYATHHNHGAGWRYTRSKGDLLHLRYRSDFTGYNHWTKRLKRALDWKMLTGSDSLMKNLGFYERRKNQSFREYLLTKVVFRPLSWIKVSLRKGDNLPDGTINGNLVFWEEDGEYIECVGPTVGVKIADFLEQEPENPHAKAISEEIRRIWSLPRP